MGFTLSISSNTSEVAMVAGASSIIFWCRRCTEQSRPNREMALPYWSAKIWTSKWRACLANCMTKIGEPGTSAWTWRMKEKANRQMQKYRKEMRIVLYKKNQNVCTLFPTHIVFKLDLVSTDLSEEVREIISTVDFTDSFSSTSLWGLHHYWVADLLCSLAMETHSFSAYSIHNIPKHMWHTFGVMNCKLDDMLTLRPSSTSCIQPSS